MPKTEIAAKSDNPITDIAPPALETATDNAPAEADVEVDMNIYPEQSETLVVIQQEPVQIEQQTEQTEQTVIQPDVQPIDVQQVVESELQVEDRMQVATAKAVSEEDVVLQSALDQAASSEELANQTSANLSLTADYSKWLSAKLRESREWLSQANRDGVSIQVLMRSKSAARELVYYLRNEWPLDLSQTYLYEVSTENRSIYRVFYSEFDSLSVGRSQLDLLPESVRVNSPYLHSVSRMQKALL